MPARQRVFLCTGEAHTRVVAWACHGLAAGRAARATGARATGARGGRKGSIARARGNAFGSTDGIALSRREVEAAGSCRAACQQRASSVWGGSAGGRCSRPASAQAREGRRRAPRSQRAVSADVRASCGAVRAAGGQRAQRVLAAGGLWGERPFGAGVGGACVGSETPASQSASAPCAGGASWRAVQGSWQPSSSVRPACEQRVEGCLVCDGGGAAIVPARLTGD
jgi:hypothetical protein